VNEVLRARPARSGRGGRNNSRRQNCGLQIQCQPEVGDRTEELEKSAHPAVRSCRTHQQPAPTSAVMFAHQNESTARAGSGRGVPRSGTGDRPSRCLTRPPFHQHNSEASGKREEHQLVSHDEAPPKEGGLTDRARRRGCDPLRAGTSKPAASTGRPTVGCIKAPQWTGDYIRE
jgi:hypothetical protein